MRLARRRSRFPRPLAAIVALVLMVQGLLLPTVALGEVTGVAIIPGSNVAGHGANDFKLKFPSGAGFAEGGTLALTFPNGMLQTELSEAQIQLGIGEEFYSLTVAPGIASADGRQSLTFPSPVAVIPQTEVIVQITSKDMGGGQYAPTIVNPSTPGTYEIGIRTPAMEFELRATYEVAAAQTPPPETTAPPDTTPPSVEWTIPYVGPQTAPAPAPLDTQVRVHYNEQIQLNSQSDGPKIQFLKNVSGNWTPVPDTGIALTDGAGDTSANPRAISVTGAQLVSGATYKVLIPANAVADLAGNWVTEEYALTFTVQGALPPYPVNMMPGPGSSNVPLDTEVRVDFDRPIRINAGHTPGEIKLFRVVNEVPTEVPATVTLTDGGGNQSDNPNAVNLLGALAYGTTYTVVIPEGVIADQNNTVLPSKVEWQFTTVPLPTTLEAGNRFPGNHARNVPVDSPVFVQFNQPIQWNTGANIGKVDLEQFSPDGKGGGTWSKVNATAGLTDENGTTVTDPNTVYLTGYTLETDRQYRLTIPGGVIASRATEPVVYPNNESFEFWTLDTLVPQPVGFTPDPNMMVTVKSAIRVHFNEGIKETATGALQGVTLEQRAGDTGVWTPVSGVTAQLTDGGGTPQMWANAVSLIGYTLNPGTRYRATIPAGTLRDDAGNVLNVPVSWEFEVPGITISTLIEGLEGMEAGQQSWANFKVLVADSGTIPNNKPLRLRLTLLKNGAPASGATMRWNDGTYANQNEWPTATADSNGFIDLAPDEGFYTLGEYQEFRSEHGKHFNAQLSLTEGTYELRAALVDVTTPTDPQVLGTTSTRTFRVVPQGSVSVHFTGPGTAVGGAVTEGSLTLRMKSGLVSDSTSLRLRAKIIRTTNNQWSPVPEVMINSQVGHYPGSEMTDAEGKAWLSYPVTLYQLTGILTQEGLIVPISFALPEGTYFVGAELVDVTDPSAPVTLGPSFGNHLTVGPSGAVVAVTGPAKPRTNVPELYKIRLQNTGSELSAGAVIALRVGLPYQGTENDLTMEWDDNGTWRPLAVMLQNGEIRTRLGPAEGFLVGQGYDVTFPVRITFKREGGFTLAAEARTPDGNTGYTPEAGLTLQSQRVRNLQAVVRNRFGNPVTNTGVLVFPLNSYRNWETAVWEHADDNGKINMSLAPGEYVLSGWNADFGMYETYVPFTVVDATDPFLNPSELMELQPNVTGTARRGTQALAKAKVRFVAVRADDTRDHQNMRWAYTDQNGQYGTYLPAGKYVLEAVEIPPMVQVDTVFTVLATGGLLDAEGQPLAGIDVNLEAPNLTGVVMAGKIPAGDTNLGFQVQGSQSYEDFVWVGTAPDGTFAVFLPPGKTYWIVDAFSHTGVQYELDKTKYPVAVDAEGVATPSTLTVQLPQPNVLGEARDQLGNLLESGHLNVKVISGGNPGQTDLWIPVRSNGEWYANLPDGEYRIVSISGTQWFEANVTFTVTDGVSAPSLVVAAPVQPNVRGVARNAAGDPIANGWITFKPSAAPEHDWASAVGTSTDANGNFGIMLAPGEWKAVGVGNRDQWFNPNLIVTVTANPISDLVLQPEQPNVTGLVRDDLGNPVPQAWLAIGPAGATEKTADWSKVHWTGTDESGAFALRLPAGSYTIFQVGTPNGPLMVTVNFTIDQTTPTATLNVQPPPPSVVGLALNDSGQPVKSGWVGIRPAAAARDAWDQHTGVPTNSSGKFRLDLPPGDYVVTSLSTRNNWIELNIPFTVTAGQQTTLTVRPPTPTLVGVVRDRNGDPIAYGHIGVRPEGNHDGQSHKWSPVDGNGNFKMALPPGRYEVMGVGTESRWMEFRISFEIVDGITTNLVVAEPRPNVTGTVRDKQGNLIQGGWLGFRPAGAREDWSQTQWANVKQDGTFEFTLPAGSWIVAQMHGNAGTAYYDLARFATPFTVAADATTNLGTVAPPANNVSGVAYRDAAKTQVLANGWINFAPAGWTEGDWSQVLWIQTDEGGAFSLYLGAGDYQVLGMDAGYWIELKTPFTAPTASLELAPRATKVTGTLTIGGQPGTATVGIRPVTGGTVSADAATTKWVPAKNGNWIVVLPDGEYEVVAVDDGTDRHSVSVRFTVTGGNATVDVSVNP